MYRYTNHTNPCHCELVKGIINVAKRVGPPSKKKIPVSTSDMRKLAVVVNPFSFIEVRDHLAFCIMLKGFLRSEQVAGLEPDNVWIEVIDGKKVLFIFVVKAKNDQFKRGNTVIIGPGLDNTFCPIIWYERYIGLRDKDASAFFHKANNAPDRATAFLDPSTFNSRFQLVLKKAGITVHLTTHCFRGAWWYYYSSRKRSTL